jgi:hypothetical protein
MFKVLLLIALLVAAEGASSVWSRKKSVITTVRTDGTITYGVVPTNEIDPNSVENLGNPNASKKFWLPKFDTRLGTLTGVSLEISAKGYYSTVIVNQFITANSAYNVTATITVTNKGAQPNGDLFIPSIGALSITQGWAPGDYTFPGAAVGVTTICTKRGLDVCCPSSFLLYPIPPSTPTQCSSQTDIQLADMWSNGTYTCKDLSSDSMWCSDRAPRRAHGRLRDCVCRVHSGCLQLRQQSV